MDRINLGRIGGFHYCLLFRNNFIWLAVGRLSIASLSAFSILTMMMNTFALAFPYISPIMNMPAWICGQMVQAEQKLCWRVGLWVHSGVKGEKDDEYKRTNRTCGVVAIWELACLWNYLQSSVKEMKPLEREWRMMCTQNFRLLERAEKKSPIGNCYTGALHYYWTDKLAMPAWLNVKSIAKWYSSMASLYGMVCV